jgi:hypothetical protein
MKSEEADCCGDGAFEELDALISRTAVEQFQLRERQFVTKTSRQPVRLSMAGRDCRASADDMGTLQYRPAKSLAIPNRADDPGRSPAPITVGATAGARRLIVSFLAPPRSFLALLLAVTG